MPDVDDETYEPDITATERTHPSIIPAEYQADDLDDEVDSAEDLVDQDHPDAYARDTEDEDEDDDPE